MNRSRLKRVTAWTAGALAVPLLLLAGMTAWLLFTTSGARWIAGTVTQRFAPQVKYGALDGTIAGVLEVRDFRFEGGAEQAKIRIERITVDPTLSMLLSRTLRIERATVAGLTFTLPEQPKEDEEDQPLWVEPPLDVVVREFALADARVFEGREQLVQVRQLGVAARWSRDELVIERLELLPGDIAGSLSASGRITPEGNTVRGALKARWRDVVIPEKLAGRTLASEGELDLDGTPDRFAARGKLDFGPPEDLAHIELAINGTNRAATIRTFDVTQRAGRLSLAGDVQYDPRLAWNLTARADDFNPGAFAAQWPGRIDLDFATRGALAEQGPRGTVRIATLSGELRGRPLAGKGEMEFAAPSRLAGVVELASGKSRITVRGETDEAINATVDLRVAVLNDWIPDTRGSLTGQFRVRGAWPKLSIEGSADGKSLAVGARRDANGQDAAAAKVGSVHVAASVETPLDPQGKIEITARDVQAAGLKFKNAHLNGSGNQVKHQVVLEASGDRLDAVVRIAGGITKGGWSGELAKLELDATEVARLALRAPARVVYDAGAFSITESCFVSDESSLCLAANLERDGALQASYSFDRVQLGLANALAPDALPGQLRGELRGAGKVRRTPDGQWFGDARIASPSAQLVLLDEEPGESALGQHTFLLYENLDVQANLEGTRGSARLSAGLDHGGKVAGNVSMSNLTAAAPALRGDVSASMPTLAPFTAFVPTVANLDGSVDARIQIGGTTSAPELTGNVAGHEAAGGSGSARHRVARG